ncbi:5-oxoprolinase subunit C family protein [Salibacterium aidingense]|uniref:5-oxoprolinase subunit C family protein n=1 Tax=Salibacterium aidingense TaxID=384933 RepID=UPI003BDF8918
MTEKALCRVKKPGLFTTIQDAGRTGWQKKGIPPAGVMDEYAFKMANFLVGNEGQEAVLEITMLGPVLRFTQAAVMAVTGGDLQPLLNNKKTEMWHSFLVKEGDELSFAGVKSGARAYIAVQGGFAGNEVLGSKSTYTKAGIGGMEGRALQADDILTGLSPSSELKRCAWLESTLIPSYRQKTLLRVTEGPEADAFSRDGLYTFYTRSFRVANESDRMGCRLQGPPVAHVKQADILSDAVDFGTIQVAADGCPMILMADRQTTGGYTRIASVIQVDLPKAAQLLPGHEVTFQKVSVARAHYLLEEQRKQFASIALASMNML